MNLLRSVVLASISTLVLSACANNPYASPGESAHRGGYNQGVYVKHPTAYQSQPRVIVVQSPNRQIYSQSSRIYTQPHQVQQYHYYPGYQHQQPRYSQQPKYNKYRDPRPQHQRPNHQRYEQYQRPDYSAQHRQNRAQRIQMRETWSQNRERMTQPPQRQHQQKNPRENHHRNYGSGIRQQRSERY